MITVVITKKHMDYPGYDTYTAHEFLVIGEQILRNIEMVLIEERVSNRKLRKVRNRMNTFNIVEIDMLPDDVIDVAESNVVQLPHGNVYVNRFKLRPVESFALAAGETDVVNATIARLSEEVCTLLTDINFDPAKGGGELLKSILELMFQGLGVHDTKAMREKILTSAMTKYSSRITTTRTDRRTQDNEIQRLDRTMRYQGLDVGDAHKVKARAVRLPLMYFKSKIDFAEYMVKRLPATVEIRKRNALKFKVCCELNDAELLKLATDVVQQEALISKYR